MSDFMCPSLHRLGLLLQSAYTRRDTGNNKDTRAIVEAELTLRRIHNRITRRRSTCRRCPFYESRRARTNGTDPDFCGYRLLEYPHLPRLRNPKVVVVGVPVAGENQLESAKVRAMEDSFQFGSDSTNRWHRQMQNTALPS